MPACPMCNKPLRELTRKCPSCQADLDLLVDYGSFLSGGLQRAENLVKAGDLPQAIWAYLEVLEVDPDNPAARKQIGQIVTAVRQFDQQSPLRRMGHPSDNGAAEKKALNPQTVRTLAFGIVIAVVFTLGLLFGFMLSNPRPTTDDPPDKPPPALGG